MTLLSGTIMVSAVKPRQHQQDVFAVGVYVQSTAPLMDPVPIFSEYFTIVTFNPARAPEKRPNTESSSAKSQNPFSKWSFQASGQTMTRRREMAITSSKVATSHTCHNTDEPIIKDQWRGTKMQGVSLGDPSAFIVPPSFPARLLRHKGVSPQTAPSFIPGSHTHHGSCSPTGSHWASTSTLLLYLVFSSENTTFPNLDFVCYGLHRSENHPQCSINFILEFFEQME